jgi:hypothetical protein
VLGSALGKALGPTLGEPLGPALEVKLGLALGPTLEEVLRAALGKALGPTLGKALALGQPQEALSVQPGGIGAFGARQHPHRDGSLFALFGLTQTSTLLASTQTNNFLPPPHRNAVGHPVGSSELGASSLGTGVGAGVRDSEPVDPLTLGPELATALGALLTLGPTVGDEELGSLMALGRGLG